MPTAPARMNRLPPGRRRLLALILAGCWLGTVRPAAAGVGTDGTVGPVRSLSGAMRIGEELGRRAGANLFHSFDRFDIATGESATFTGSGDIANVISRVTGRLSGPRASSIDGLLRSEVGHADVFLINPAGVVFGPNAQVDVPAAFHVSTADRLNFPDGYYSATDTAGSTLSMAAPESFGFLARQPPADIAVRGSQLTFKQGQIVSLVGGNVTVASEGSGTGRRFARVSSAGGDVRVVAVGTPAAESRVGFDDASSTEVPKGRVEISGGSTVDVSGAGGPASIRMRGGTVDIAGDSKLLAKYSGDTDSAGVVRIEADAIGITDSTIDASTAGAGRGNSIDLKAAGSLRITHSTVAADTDSSGPQAAPMRLSAREISVVNSDVRALVSGSGPGADIEVKADQLTIDAATATDGALGIRTLVQTGATGSAGEVRVTAHEVVLTNGGQISSNVDPGGLGHGGNLVLRIGGSLTLSGRNDARLYSGLYATTQSPAASGTGGDILIEAPQAALSLTRGAAIEGFTTGGGNAGAIRIAAANFTASNYSWVYAPTTGSGAGGNITIAVAESLTLDGFASIESWSWRGSGAAGRIELAAGGSLLLSEAKLDSSGWSGGAAGGQRLSAGLDLALAGATLDARTLGAGSAGAVALHAGRDLRLDGGTIIKSWSEYDSGAAGRIDLSAGGNLQLNQATLDSSGRSGGAAGGQRLSAGLDLTLKTAGLDASTFGSGAAGRIELAAGGNLNLVQAKLESSGSSGGAAGHISIFADGDISLSNRASIDVYTGGMGQAGNIELAASGAVAVVGGVNLYAYSACQTDAAHRYVDTRLGEAGRITIAADSLRVSDSNLWVVSENRANAGVIDLSARHEIRIDGTLPNDPARLQAANLRPLTANPIDATRLDQEGRSGTVRLAAQSVVLGPATIIDIGTNAGNGGLVTIDAGVLGVFDGAVIKATAASAGAAGEVQVHADGDLLIRNQARFIADTIGQGPAGRIALSADGAVDLTHGAILYVDSRAPMDARGQYVDGRLGDAGRITITAGDINLRDSNLSANSWNRANAGLIELSALGDIRVETTPGAIGGLWASNSRLESLPPVDPAAGDGRSGNIRLSAGDVVLTGDTVIDISSTAGDGGSVTVTGRSLNLLNGADIWAVPTGPGRGGDVRVSVNGAVTILGRDLWGEGKSEITTATADGSYSPGPHGPAGAIEITAGSLTVGTGGWIDSSSFSSYAAAAGDMTLNIGTLEVVDGGQIQSSTLGAGDAGDILINATQRVLVRGMAGEVPSTIEADTSGLLSGDLRAGSGGGVRISAPEIVIEAGAEVRSATYANGTAGAVTLFAPRLTISSGGEVNTSTAGFFGNGPAGAIDILADTVVIDGRGGESLPQPWSYTGIFSVTQTGGGDAGNIRIQATTGLSLLGGAAIQSDAAGSGAAGRVDIALGGLLLLDQSEVSATTTGSGAGGAVQISAADLIAVNGAGIRSSTAGSGNAGTLDLSISGLLALAPGTELSTATTGAGDAGRLGVRAGTLDVDGATLSSRAAAGAGGLAGDIAVGGGTIALRNGARISSASDQTLAPGRPAGGGRINIDAGTLRLDGAASINAASTGNVPAGSIRIIAGALTLAGLSAIDTESWNADGGPITIDTGALWLNDSRITTSVLGTAGNGGDISIRTGLLGLNGGFIQANTAAAGAAGGNVLIEAGRVVLSRGFVLVGGNTRLAFRPGSGFNVIQAAAPFGVAGNITTTVPQLDVTRGLAVLATPVGDPGALVRDRCLAGNPLAGSSLVERPLAGVPPGPQAPAAVSFAGERLDRLLAEAR